jgi:penicillin-binding protein 1A
MLALASFLECCYTCAMNEPDFTELEAELAKKKPWLTRVREVCTYYMRLAWLVLQHLWQNRHAYWQVRRVRIGTYVLGTGAFMLLLFWALILKDLPSLDALRNTSLPMATTVRDSEGMPVHSFAQENRLQISYNEMPTPLIYSYLAAEDHSFFSHSGVDVQNIFVAVLGNVVRSGRPRGASTITQQVIKNLFLSSEVSLRRKVQEVILAKRIETVLSKQQILQLYLNQIYLGRNAYGVEAGARAYFGKSVKELSLAQSAFLAGIPKSPNQPDANLAYANGRKDYVLNEMLRYKFITQAQYTQAHSEKIALVERHGLQLARTQGYFMEEVRRLLISKFQAHSENGKNPNSVYGGGLWVRSSYNPAVQSYAETALREGLLRFGGHSWNGPVDTIKIDDDWRDNLNDIAQPGIEGWKLAVVLQKNNEEAQIGFAEGTQAKMHHWDADMPSRLGVSAFNAMKQGDVIVVKAKGNDWVLQYVPEISGAILVEDPHTGRVLAMQGGFDSQLQPFNRATQAKRQPGSSFKPIAYVTALQHGFTPVTMVEDGEFCVASNDGTKCFKNFQNEGGEGEHSLRWGLEQSRNLMTVRVAAQTGMDNIVETAAAMGISEPGKRYPAVLSISLGAGETTVARMTNAYSILAQNGREVKQSLIDYVQDRSGKMIFRADDRACMKCNAAEWDGKPMPRPAPRTKQIVDAQSAYQMVHIMEGVVQNGTAVRLKAMNRPLFGKTGTTTGPNEVWFVGGSPDLVAGVYIGYDKPRPLGEWAQGGTVAVPIFESFATKAMKDMPPRPFQIAPGIRMVRVERLSGERVFGVWPSADLSADVIWEAFKPDTEPTHSIRRDQLPVKTKAAQTQAPDTVGEPVETTPTVPLDSLQSNGIY